MKEQRKSSRRATAAPHPRCELKLGSAVWPAMLLNESDSGFAVLVGGVPIMAAMAANQRVQLRNDQDWFDGRIIYAKEVVATQTIIDPTAPEQEATEADNATIITAADIADFTAGGQGPWFRVGIRRLRKIATPAEPTASPPIRSYSLNPMQWIKRML